MASLGGSARQAMEDLMRTGNYQYQSDFARRYVAGLAFRRVTARELALVLVRAHDAARVHGLASVL